MKAIIKITMATFFMATISTAGAFAFERDAPFDEMKKIGHDISKVDESFEKDFSNDFDEDLDEKDFEFSSKKNQARMRPGKSNGSEFPDSNPEMRKLKSEDDKEKKEKISDGKKLGEIKMDKTEKGSIHKNEEDDENLEDWTSKKKINPRQKNVNEDNNRIHRIK